MLVLDSLALSVLCFERRSRVGGDRVFDSGYMFCQPYVTSKKAEEGGVHGMGEEGVFGVFGIIP